MAIMYTEVHDMEWNLVIHDEDRYLEVVTIGMVDGDGTIDMAKAIAKTMKSHRLTKALIDHRNVEGLIGDTSATYSRPKIFRFIGLTLGIKIAEIIRPEDEGHFRFFESVCLNQGYRLSVFQDKDKALTWLLT
jgi:hypothetical protein